MKRRYDVTLSVNFQDVTGIVRYRHGSDPIRRGDAYEQVPARASPFNS